MGRVIPFPSGAPAEAALDDTGTYWIPREQASQEFICPVCAESGEHAEAGLERCRTCGALVHHECYWGRVASLDEWRTFLRWIMSEVESPMPPTACPACPACRAAKGDA